MTGRLPWYKRLRGFRPSLMPHVPPLGEGFPVPLLWMIGKAQAGKSSLIRGIVGDDGIAVGEGFRPCTRSSAVYSYPGDEAPLIRFLDTRGLLEVGYDPAEDIAYAETQSHLLVVVVRIDDHATGGLIAALRAIKKRNPALPVILALTCLHVTYEPGQGHIVPYPYGSGVSSAIPLVILDHVEEQKRAFAEFSPVVIPVDFTLPEDGYDPANYGRDALLEGAERLLPEVLWNVIRELSGGAIMVEWMTMVQPTLLAFSLAAGSAAAIPAPIVDLSAVASVQLLMLRRIAQLCNQPFDRRALQEIISTLGLGLLFRMGGRSILKFIPGGIVVQAASVASLTYGLGNAYCLYLLKVREGHKPDPEELRRLYEEKVAEGKNLFGVQRSKAEDD